MTAFRFTPIRFRPRPGILWLCAGWALLVSPTAFADAGFHPLPDEAAQAAPPDASPADPWDPRQTLDLRNPFLPPGFQPRSGEDAADTNAPEPEAPDVPTEAQWDAARSTLRIRGIGRIRDEIAATVNGRVVTAGDVIETRIDGRRFRWIIEDIALRTGLQLRRLSEEDSL